MDSHSHGQPCEGFKRWCHVLEAIQRAGSTDGDKIREAMAKADFTGATGKVKFDGDRNPVKSAVIIQIKDGKPGEPQGVDRCVGTLIPPCQQC